MQELDENADRLQNVWLAVWRSAQSFCRRTAQVLKFWSWRPACQAQASPHILPWALRSTLCNPQHRHQRQCAGTSSTMQLPDSVSCIDNGKFNLFWESWISNEDAARVSYLWLCIQVALAAMLRARYALIKATSWEDQQYKHTGFKAGRKIRGSPHSVCSMVGISMMVRNGAIRIFGLQKLATVGQGGYMGRPWLPAWPDWPEAGVEQRVTSRHAEPSTVISHVWWWWWASYRAPSSVSVTMVMTLIQAPLLTTPWPSTRNPQNKWSNLGITLWQGQTQVVVGFAPPVVHSANTLKTQVLAWERRLESLREGSHTRVFVTHLSPP